MVAEFASHGTPGGIFTLVREGHARSRAGLARLTGLAPSTVALRVDALLRGGYLEEVGDGESRGGRRPRRLAVASTGRVVAGIDVGGSHLSVGLYDLGGALLAATRTEQDLSGTPLETLSVAFKQVEAALEGLPQPAHLVGIGLAVPGPVSEPDRRLTSPSRMPGWSGVDPAELLAGIAGVPVLTENDANAMAWGEFVGEGSEGGDLILVKAASSIGTGIVAGGRLHRGVRGMAGDVSHTPVPESPQVLCTCGRFGCLDVVAGGRAIVESLRGAGVEVAGVDALAGLAADGHPLATRLLRESGLRTGAVLATLVSFLNPGEVVLAGPLAKAEAFVAGVRSSVYGLCLPMSTTGLVLRESEQGEDLGALGAARLFLDDRFTAAAVDEVIADLMRGSNEK